MSNEERNPEGVQLEFDSYYQETYDQFAEMYFEGQRAKSEALVFFLCLGLRLGKKRPVKEWKGKRQASQMMSAIKENFADFPALLRCLELEGERTATTMSEYIVAGMDFVHKNDLHLELNFDELGEEIPELFSEDIE